MEVIVNDIDGNAFHTTDSGTPDEVMARSDDRLRAQIERAMSSEDGVDQETYVDAIDGEERTVKVIVKRDLFETIGENTEVRRHNGQNPYGDWFDLLDDSELPRSIQEEIVDAIIEEDVDEDGVVQCSNGQWYVTRYTTKIVDKG